MPVSHIEWIVVCFQLEQMKATKEDKLRRLAEMKAARLLHRSLEAERACELLKGISRMEERERFDFSVVNLSCFLPRFDIFLSIESGFAYDNGCKWFYVGVFLPTNASLSCVLNTDECLAISLQPSRNILPVAA